MLEDVFADHRAATLVEAVRARDRPEPTRPETPTCYFGSHEPPAEDPQIGVVVPVADGVTADPDWMVNFARHLE